MSNKLSFFLLILLGAFSATHTAAQSAADSTPRREFVYYARQLQEHIGPQNTDYRHKDNIVGWGGNGSPWQCYADSSGFIRELFVYDF